MTAPVLIGSQVPTYEWVPPHAGTSGPDVVEFGSRNGLVADPWQAHVLGGALSETEEGQWACNEVCLILGRQNGKGGVIELRQLAGVFLFGERLILHSAHQQRTSNDAFTRMLEIVESAPDLDRRIQVVARSKGEESITFNLGSGRYSKIRYMARSGAGGRGLTKADTVFLDEAMILDDGPVAALLPTMATQPNWQVWYTASAGDLKLPTQSVVLGRVRRRALRRNSTMAAFLWEAHTKHGPDCSRNVEGVCEAALDIRTDPRTWAKTNPAMNIRIKQSFLHKMCHGGMASWDFDREFLGVGLYPADDGWNVFAEETWTALCDRGSRLAGGFAVGIEATWDKEQTSVCVAGLSLASTPGHEVFHVEALETRPGTEWAVDYCKQLKKRKPIAYVVDPKGPAGHIIQDLERDAVIKRRLVKPTLTQYAAWCGKTEKMVDETATLRHLGQPSLDKAVRAVQKRSLGQGAIAWERADTTDNVAPWIGCNLALGGLFVKGTKRTSGVFVVGAAS